MGLSSPHLLLLLFFLKGKRIIHRFKKRASTMGRHGPQIYTNNALQWKTTRSLKPSMVYSIQMYNKAKPQDNPTRNFPRKYCTWQEPAWTHLVEVMIGPFLPLHTALIVHKYRFRLPKFLSNFFFPFLLHPSARALRLTVRRNLSRRLLVENYTMTTPIWLYAG
jgi:hypothetical protein